MGKLAVKHQNKVLLVDPIGLSHQLQLLVLPLHQIAVVFSLLHFVALQLYEIFDLLHRVSDIVGLRNVHTKAKNLQFLA